MELSREELILLRKVLMARVASCDGVIADEKANNTARAEAATQRLRANIVLDKIKDELGRVNAEIQAEVDRKG